MDTNYKRTRLPRIVLAEDDRAFARLVEIALKRTGIAHHLETVHDGPQAIDALAHDAPDLLLLDLYMPGMSGFDVLQHVKSDARLRRTPVVMFSSSDADADVRRAYDLHVNAFIRKSSDFGDLCHTMGTVLHFWLQTAARPSYTAASGM
jgi:two-component system, chemotaxis family, response regulator Rcp1